MKLTDTGLTVQDIKDKVNTYMIETYERMDFLCETPGISTCMMKKARNTLIFTLELR